MKAVLDERRHIAFEGTPNFRDYGGYQTLQGGQVKWGRLFRSGQLAALTERDLERLALLDIQLVFDFRRDDECQKDPSQFPSELSPTVIGLPINPGSSFNFLDALARGELTSGDMVDFMRRVNREFVESQSGNYRQMFEHLLGGPTGASLVHCSAGKDRTGFAAAMVLTVLGVPRAVVIEDYLLTSHYFDIDREIARASKKYQWKGDTTALRPLLEAREEYLGAAFDAIEEGFASLEEYLEEELGINRSAREALRKQYVEC